MLKINFTYLSYKYMELFEKTRPTYGARESQIKELKDKHNLGAIIQLWITLLHLGPLLRSVLIIK